LEAEVHCYEYDNGTWKEIEDPVDWRNNEEFTSALRRSGWSTDAVYELGSSDLGHATVYEPDPKKQARLDGCYLIDLMLGPSNITLVLIRSHLNLILFLKEVSPILQLAVMTAQENDRQVGFARQLNKLTEELRQ
jgi:hypothetical protein